MTTTITPTERIGFVEVLALDHHDSVEQHYRCVCHKCDVEYVWAASKLRVWKARRKHNPAAFIGCRHCHRRHKNSTSSRRADNSMRKQHHVTDVRCAPKHKKASKCDLCAGQAHRREDEQGNPRTCPECKGEYRALPPVRAVGSISSGAGQALLGVGYV